MLFKGFWGLMKAIWVVSVNGGYMGAGRAFEGYRRLNRA